MTTKTLVNPAELQGELPENYSYDQFESDLFEVGLYPEGHHIFVDQIGVMTLKNEKLKTTILSFMEKNQLEEFYFDEDE